MPFSLLGFFFAFQTELEIFPRVTFYLFGYYLPSKTSPSCKMDSVIFDIRLKLQTLTTSIKMLNCLQSQYLKQKECHEFETSLGCSVRPCLKTKQDNSGKMPSMSVSQKHCLISHPSLSFFPSLPSPHAYPLPTPTLFPCRTTILKQDFI